MGERQKPTLIKARLETGEIKTVRADDIQPGTKPYHETLSDEQKLDLEQLYRQVGKLARPDQEMLQWVDRFRYDQNPDAEIAHWKAIARTFDRMGGKSRKPERQSKLLSGILAVSIGTVDVESQTGLGTNDVTRIRRTLFAEHPSSIAWVLLRDEHVHAEWGPKGDCGYLVFAEEAIAISHRDKVAQTISGATAAFIRGYVPRSVGISEVTAGSKGRQRQCVWTPLNDSHYCQVPLAEIGLLDDLWTPGMTRNLKEEVSVIRIDPADAARRWVEWND